jgi:hypothetical protein
MENQPNQEHRQCIGWFLPGRTAPSSFIGFHFCEQTFLVANALLLELLILLLQVGGNLGELVEGGLEVLGDFGGDYVGIGEVGRIFQAFVF